MLHIDIAVDELDYDALIELLLPLVADRLDKDSSLGKLVSGGGGTMARALFKKLPRDKKDRAVAELVNKYNEKLIEKAEGYAARNGVRVRIDHISASA